MNVVILTGSELRHTFMRKAIALAPGVDVVRSYCEGAERNLRRSVESQEEESELRLRHLAARERSEQDFFSTFVAAAPDHSHPVHLPKGEINQPRHASDIGELDPDILVAYGCSIIREPLLSQFAGRFLNVHLGLSPYYRGGGTNFWPLVEGRPEYVGATFMHIDAGIDTGEIIHQIRARIFPGDTPHHIGNRLISDVALVYSEIIRQFRALQPMEQIPPPPDARVCRRKDFSEDSVRALYQQFASGLVERYIAERDRRCEKVPIVVNPAIAPIEKLVESGT